MNLLRSSTVRYLIRKLRLPTDEANLQAATQNIRTATEFRGANVWVLVSAIFIACLGLNMNSAVVIIGAMLISPLLGPVSGFGLGLGINDILLVKKAVRNFAVMVFVSVLSATLFFLVSPLSEPGTEMLAYTSPTVYDVLIAFAGGATGTIASASQLRRSNVIPGVALATSLMPPLCTLGFGISHANWTMVFGAFYLFMINSVLIGISTFLAVTLLGYPRVKEREPKRRRRITWIISCLIILMIAPSVYLTFHIIKKSVFQQQASRFIEQEIRDRNHVVVSSQLSYKPRHTKLEVVLIGDVIDSSGVLTLKSRMGKYGLTDCELVLYQGQDARAAARNMFDDLSEDVQLQRMSIRNIYLRMDSLQQEQTSFRRNDTLHVQLARELKKADTTLTALSIEPERWYNPAYDKYDTLWRVGINFSRQKSSAGERQLLAWFQQRLHTSAVKMNVY
jgi:uncharacterized hydrophobic protein (TIGR00271 family)